VHILKHFWQRLAQRFKPRALRRAGESEPGLSAASQEKQHLLEQLTGLRTDMDHELSASRQQQQSLQEQLITLQASTGHGLSTANAELQALHGELAGLKGEVERGLSAQRAEQQNLLAQLTGLQADFARELAAANREKEALHGQITRLRDDLEHLRTRDEQLRGELQQQFDQLRTERDAAHRSIEALRSSMADAASRQEANETRVNTLEHRLLEQHQAQQVALQEALVRERRQARRVSAATTVAVAAFVLGITGSAINFWEVQNTSRLLVGVSQGIRDIRSAMEGFAGDRAQAPGEATPSVPSREPGQEKPAASGPVPATGESRAPSDTKEGLPGQKLPVPEFVASGSLPLDDHTFRSRKDVHAFFEENATQPGVVSLPSGLQYRPLIAGTGKSPGTSDKVVIEYRAFRPDGTELDNSFKKDLPTTFIVSDAIPALKEALPQMQEGAQWELYIPPELAYKGVRKRGPRGFEPLILTVELLSVVTPEAGKAQ
jgi:predicted  nucleic acid-binding Zn-ribbon protein